MPGLLTVTALPMEDVEKAKALYNSDPGFKMYVDTMIEFLKEGLMNSEEILTGAVLAVGEYEYHIEPKIKCEH